MILCITINCHFFVCLGSLICRMVAEEGPKPMVITLRYKYEYTTLIQIQLKIQTEILPELTCQQVGSREEQEGGGGIHVYRPRREAPAPPALLSCRPAGCLQTTAIHPPTTTPHPLLLLLLLLLPFCRGGCVINNHGARLYRRTTSEVNFWGIKSLK